MKRLAAVLAVAAGLAGSAALAAPASAQEATACVKARVTVNGSDVVNVDECHTFPPAE